MPQFETVFDGSQFHISAGMIIGLLIIGIGVLLLVAPPRLRRWLHADDGQITITKPYPGKVRITRLGLVAVLCAGLWIAHAALGERYADTQCRTLLESGKYKIVEGLIHGVWYQAKSQGFSVQNLDFSYSYGVDTGGFNGSLFNNPVREGEYARIYYVDNVIIKMQIRR